MDIAQPLIKRNRNFRLLLSATAVSNLGDGISMVAFPWLATLVTRDPAMIGLVAAVGRLPWLLLTAPAGVLADRADRQKILVWADLVRTVLTCLVLALVMGGPTLPLDDGHASEGILIAGLAGLAFLLGAAEVLRDNTAQTALPSVVDKNELEKANGQIWSVEQITGQFIGPPLAGLLLAVALPLPFLFDAVTFLLAAVLVARIRFSPAESVATHGSFWQDLSEGARWLWGHATLLKLAIFLGLINMFSMATLTILVLFAQEVLGLSAFGYGVLMTASAAGGVVGGFMAPGIISKLGGQRVFLLAQVGFITMPLAVWLSSSAYVIAMFLFVSMFSAVSYNVVTVSYRQRAIPDALLGRVNSLYRMFGWGMMPIGAFCAGILVSTLEPLMGREASLRFPYLISVVGFCALLAWSRAAIHIPQRGAE